NRVLVIDDDSEVRRVVQELLESAGFQVMSAPDGEQGLALLEGSMADAVLCDIFMPNKEGIETCTELRRRYPALRVVAMSGASGATGYLRAAEKLGAVASLRKPFTGQELVAVVQGALAGRFSG
ncbi:MAG TPA: response regulator, partial [Planctomycetota bacterium]|nr:response regulator [Planctomycetota bacterium]